MFPRGIVQDLIIKLLHRLRYKDVKEWFFFFSLILYYIQQCKTVLINSIY